MRCPDAVRYGRDGPSQLGLVNLISGVLLTHACLARPAKGGEWEYLLWAIGTGHLTNAYTSLPSS